MRARPLDRPLIPAILISTLVIFGSPVSVRTQQADEYTQAALSVLGPAAAELERLNSFEGTSRSRSELLRRNLSRYFALSMVPSNTEEFGRVVGAAERMSRSVAEQVYREAEALARAEGLTAIGKSHIHQVMARLLPSRRTDYKEIMFFFGASFPMVVEEIDLESFYDTGFSWQILAFVGDAVLQADPMALPMEPEAARVFTLGINSYGLLLFRIGGLKARADLAPNLQTRHLRAAGKTIEQHGADLAPLPPRVQTQAPKEGPPWFTDVTGESGLHFRHVSSDWIARFRRYGFIAPSFSGGGVSAGHLNDDRWVDLVVCGGQGCAVFFNQGNGTFADATSGTGLSVDGEARMPVLADFDNDGRVDVFITYAQDTNLLFRNIGGGRFEPATAGSGLDQQGDISGPAVAFDYDNDGLLDIYVGNFGNYLEGEAPWSPNNSVNGQPNRLYRNLGNLSFEDVTGTAGVANTGWTQALSHFDFDQDGDQDLYIANDFGPNDLLVNNGDGTFASAGVLTGSDDPFHGMNVAFADLNHDRHADIFITNIWFWSPAAREVTETNSLYLSRPADSGPVLFDRVEDPEFLQHDTGWSWGSVFVDADNDGDEDLYVVNGFTDYLTFAQYRPSPNYPDELYAINNGSEPNWFFRNDEGLPILHVPNSGAELPGVNSRGVSPLDYDGDGDLDLAVSTFHSTLRLFRNDGAPADNHWLSLELVGDPARGTSRDAVGAQVFVTSDEGFYAWRMRTGGESYLAMGSPELELGLGEIGVVDLEVLWPGGQRQTFDRVPADSRIRLRQGQPNFEVLPAP